MTSPAESNVVLPCPFCGGRPRPYTRCDAPSPKNVAYIMCHECQAYGPAMHGINAQADALKAWNRRPDAAA